MLEPPQGGTSRAHDHGSAGGGELVRERASDAGAAARDDGETAAER
jgi:hypothetical protein